MFINNGFSLIGHPPTIESLQKFVEFFEPEYRKKRIKNELLVTMFQWMPPFKAFEIIAKQTTPSGYVKGFFVLSTFFPQLVSRSWKKTIAKVSEAVSLCEKHGARVTALGGFTSIVDGRSGRVVAKSADKMAVTNGSTLTTAFTVKGIEKICNLVDQDLSNATMAIIGATGSIGKTCARYFHGKTRYLILTGRKMNKLANSFPAEDWRHDSRVELSTDNNAAAKRADIVICVTSSVHSLFSADSFKSGAIVCDVGFPKTVSSNCANRPDILVYMGGLCKMPWAIDEATAWGLGSKELESKEIVYGCFAEAMIVDLEECYQYCTVGDIDIELESVELLYEIAMKHGFNISPFFNSEKHYLAEDFQKIRSIIYNSKMAGRDGDQHLIN